jgi:transposase-like protein
MIVESKKGVSANQLKRTLQVSYRTAWYLCHRIRKAMETPEGILRGIVEIDETWIGGKSKWTSDPKSRRPSHNKTMVIGAAERNGIIRLKAQPGRPSPTREVVAEFVAKNVDTSAVVYTDEAHAYPKVLANHAGHETVKHSADEFVRGPVHTNTIEGAWGLFKRSIIGSYHQLSVKHLDAYLDEFEFRFNNRENPKLFEQALRLMLGPERLEYRTLVG